MPPRYVQVESRPESGLATRAVTSDHDNQRQSRPGDSSDSDESAAAATQGLSVTVSARSGRSGCPSAVWPTQSAGPGLEGP